MTPEQVKAYAQAHVAFRTSLHRDQLVMFDHLRAIEQRATNADADLHTRFGFALGVVVTVGALLALAVAAALAALLLA